MKQQHFTNFASCNHINCGAQSSYIRSKLFKSHWTLHIVSLYTPHSSYICCEHLNINRLHAFFTIACTKFKQITRVFMKNFTFCLFRLTVRSMFTECKLFVGRFHHKQLYIASQLPHFRTQSSKKIKRTKNRRSVVYSILQFASFSNAHTLRDIPILPINAMHILTRYVKHTWWLMNQRKLSTLSIAKSTAF